MMKKFMFFVAITALSTFVLSCGSGASKTPDKFDKKEVSSEAYYTCSMHPEIHSDKPGKCPKCGMELIKKESAINDSTLTQTPDSLMQK